MNDEVKRYWTAELWDNEETQDAMVVLAADYEALQAKLAECQHTVRVLESSEEDAQQAAVKFKTERDEWKRRAKEKDRQHEIECLEVEVDRLKIELGNALRQEDAEHSREEVSINLDQLPFEVKPEDEPNLMSWHAAMELFEDDPNGWRLPTKDELYLIYKHRDKIGGFTPDGYWSSSKRSSGYAWFQFFDSGNQHGGNDKCYYIRVRAVRDKKPQRGLRMSELDNIRARVEGHTPGPWVALQADVVEVHKYKLWEPLEGDGKQVVEGAELSLWEATIPDAMLIAAAPDLLQIAIQQEQKITAIYELAEEGEAELRAENDRLRAMLAEREETDHANDR